MLRKIYGRWDLNQSMMERVWKLKSALKPESMMMPICRYFLRDLEHVHNISLDICFPLNLEHDDSHFSPMQRRADTCAIIIWGFWTKYCNVGEEEMIFVAHGMVPTDLFEEVKIFVTHWVPTDLLGA